MSWTLRYASHLGFRSLEAPLFPASAGSVDPLAQIDFAASIGFAGIQDPWCTTRPLVLQEAIADRLAQHGLAAGCVVCGSPSTIRTPLWNAHDGRNHLEAELSTAFATAKRIGARQIAVLTGAEPDVPRARQIEIMVGHLTWAGDRAESEGFVLCLEPTNARTLPGMLLSHFDEGCEIVRATGRRAVRMIFDTAHVQSMDGDLLGRLERHLDWIDVVQIANHPGRSEPEVGEIAMGAVLEKLQALGWGGLVELEHLWSRPGWAAEQRGLAWLRAADASLDAANKGSSR